MKNDQELQSEQLKRYKYIIENIKDVIWEMNMDFVFTFVSPNVHDMLGYEVEEIVGRKMPDFLIEESRNYFFNESTPRTKRRIDGDTEGIFLYDVQFICKNGLVKWVQVSAKPMFGAKKFMGYIGSTRDITETKEYESQLKEYIEELRTLNSKLEKMATLDVLTGAYNRRKFDDDLNALIVEKEKHGIIFSLIFFDLDHFKTINDCYGHKTGDIVLRQISELVLKNIRTTDRLFRWGGEEFIILLNGSNFKNAKKVAGKLWRIIQNHDFGISRKITISMGVGEYKLGETTDQIIIRLDTALLKAKSEGRNRVISC
ncbi:sensor domain-containing diguanylate cyclase [Desulfosporosinus sp. FKA]|uniref:sensor domain-containing diguanylate cyclase n=1 Tax=Desulfosporosinus sp. FKA TaxID=1969834 RepID=UPI000B49CE67|nr:sensor domain-containing diguanylate cyclase [Desulfosporosinus sp. FKA]